MNKMLLIGAGVVAAVGVAVFVVMNGGGGTPILSYSVVRTFPHDPTSFTQGFVWHDGHLFEGTGLKGASKLRKVELETGKVVQEEPLPGQVFGEGIAILGKKIYQLTYKAQQGLVYDLETFKRLRQFKYSGEGWGLTHDGSRLIMSNGTPEIRFLDPESLETIGSLTVSDDRGPVAALNELEYIDGKLWANIFQVDRIAQIDLVSGKVLAYVELHDLRKELDAPGEVLNGIAWDAAKRRMFVTGKNWSKIFEIKIDGM